VPGRALALAARLLAAQPSNMQPGSRSLKQTSLRSVWENNDMRVAIAPLIYGKISIFICLEMKMLIFRGDHKLKTCCQSD